MDSDPASLSRKLSDSSAVTKFVTKEPGWEEIKLHVSESKSLRFAILETANALWKKVRKNEVDFELSKSIIRGLKQGLWLLDEGHYLERAQKIATKHSITVYDSLFIACSEIEGYALVTSDSKQFNVARGLGVEAILV